MPDYYMVPDQLAALSKIAHNLEMINTNTKALNCRLVELVEVARSMRDALLDDDGQGVCDHLSKLSECVGESDLHETCLIVSPPSHL